MDSNLSLIKALATTLLSEIDSLNANGQILDEENSFHYAEIVREFEIKLIKTALTRTGGNQTRAAKLLGIKLSTLNNKIQTYNIQFLKFDTEPEKLAFLSDLKDEKRNG